MDAIGSSSWIAGSFWQLALLGIAWFGFHRKDERAEVDERANCSIEAPIIFSVHLGIFRSSVLPVPLSS
jgi:hypothetical protein